MDVRAHTLGHVFDRIPNHSMEVSTRFLQKQGDIQSECRHKDPAINNAIEFIRNNVANNYMQNTMWSKLSTDAASKEFMNQEILPFGFQNLIQQETFDTNPYQQVASRLTSLPPPITAWGMSPGFFDSNSDYPQVDYFMVASADCNTYSTDNINDFGFFEGSPCKGYSQGVTAPIRDCHWKNMFLPLGSEITSPGQISSITACSDGDGFSDIEPFYGATTFPGSSLQYVSEPSSTIEQQRIDQGELNLIKYRGIVENNHNVYPVDFPSLLGENVESPYSDLLIREDPQCVPEASDFLPATFFNKPRSTHEDLLQSQIQKPASQQLNQWPHQPYLQFNEQYQSYSQWFSGEQDECFNQTVGRKEYKLLPLPSEHSHGVQHVSSVSSPLDFEPMEATKLTDSSIVSLHRILLSYVNHKSVPGDIGRVPFLNHMHWTECNDRECNCNLYVALVSHFDNCHYSSCDICGPVRRLCVTGKVDSESGKLKNDISGAFNDREYTGTSTNTIVDELPPSKRLKMENPILLAKRASYGLAPSVNQPCGSEGLPQLVQWPEAPVFNADAMEVDEELLSPTEDPTITSLIRDDVTENAPKLDFNSASIICKELIIGCKQGKIHHTSINEITNDAVDNTQGLNSDSVAVLSDEPTSGHKGAIQVKSKPDQAISEAECDLLASAADYDSPVKLEEPKIQGVSLAELFTAAQMKEHLSSFGQWSGQEVTGNTMHAVGENICQLCATDKLVFAPTPMYCSSCGARIKHNLIYYRTLDETSTRHCFCTSCFKGSRGGNVLVHGVAISKAKLQKERNNVENEESWVQCDKCERWQHQICALYNDKRDLEGKAEYICPICCLEEIKTGERLPLPNSAAFGAKDLPRTMLSDHIEKRLFTRLLQEREERANVLGKKLDEVPGAADLVVRVVVSVDKQLKVQQQFLDIFREENYPSEFSYRSKVILLFQRIEGVDVCLFGMYVQEFGSECGRPNQRCVYISYLDSVKYFRPKTGTVTGEALRTFVYHEILIGYLDYCKKQGFATCYIWACPPLKGEDYILYCHPDTQKTPKSDKLRRWYKLMLRKAADDNIVVDYTNLYDHFFVPTGDCNSKITAARLPYFDGDYWSGVATDISRNIDQESGGELQTKVKKLMTKRTLKAMGHRTPSDATKDILVMQKLGQTILPVKEDFIIVHLQFTCMRCHEVILSGSRWFCNQCKNVQLCSGCLDSEQDLNEKKTHTSNSGEKHLLSQAVVNDVPVDTEDKDVTLENSFFENRHTLLSFCQENHYQFDTLRRAKHSSMMILFHLQKLTAHLHKSSQRSSLANCGVKNKQDRQQKALRARELLNVLMHVSQCHATTSKPCSYPMCPPIRMLFRHERECNIQATGGCELCRKTWLMLSLHSRNCRDSSCKLPHCTDLNKCEGMLAFQSETARKAAVAGLASA